MGKMAPVRANKHLVLFKIMLDQTRTLVYYRT